MINKVESINMHNMVDTRDVVRQNTGEKVKSENIKSDRNFDRVEINNDNISEIDKLRVENDKRVENFKELIRGMISKQGEKSNLKLFGKNLNVTLKDSEKAKEAISEGGEYSVEVVAGRIMDMAKALANGDKIKINLLKKAVQDGFKAAGMEFNGGAGLPDISNKTYDEVMRRFDEWENG